MPPTDSVPMVEPRLERLFGADSLRLLAGVGGPFDLRGPALSPDGRWVVFGALEQADRSNLWLAPVAGGDRIRLTRGRYLDDHPRWFASNEEVAFLSSRPGGPSREGTFVMRIPISPENGSPRGPPRQVSLETAHTLAVSPEDRWIAYGTRGQEDPSGRADRLRVVPARGGPARTVATVPGAILAVRWGKEGDNFYVLTSMAGEQDALTVLRIPVEGGKPEQISAWDQVIQLSVHARLLLREIRAEEEGERCYELSTVLGRPLVRLQLPDSFQLVSFGKGEGGLLAVQVDVANPLRIVPVAGGPVRRLNAASDYDIPLGWSPDGQEVFFKTQLDRGPVYRFASLVGDGVRQVSLPDSLVEGWPILSGDGEHVLFFAWGDRGRNRRRISYEFRGNSARKLVEGPEPPGYSFGRRWGIMTPEASRGIMVFDIRLKSVRKLDEGPEPPGFSFFRRWGITGPGGTFMRDRSTFLYGVTRQGRHELMAADPEGDPRVLWSFTDRENPPEVAVHGDWVAYTENDGQEGSLYLARGGESRARLLLVRRGVLSPRSAGGAIWSPDRRRLAVPYASSELTDPGVLIVELNENGEVVGEPLELADAGISRWMPDGHHFLGTRTGAETSLWETGVWLWSLDPDVAPVPLTGDLHESIWYFTLSPDGRYIAIESETPRSSSIWRVGLPGIRLSEIQDHQESHGSKQSRDQGQGSRGDEPP